MPRTRKKETGKKDPNLFDEDHTDEASDEELPTDEAGRKKIKKRYEELLGIRIDKLKGRVLNRERINKTVEGVYFICSVCKKICHNLDEGLIEDPDNIANQCTACSKIKGKNPQAAA